jgi:hypothetical protein
MSIPMFLTEGQTPDPPQVIPLPGSRGWQDVPPHPGLFEDFADVYPERLTLGTLWGTGPTEPTYPDDDDDDPPVVVNPPETRDWGDGSFDEALTFGAALMATETSAAVYVQALAASPDAFAIGVALSATETTTMISLVMPTDGMNFGAALGVTETDTGRYLAPDCDPVDMGLSLEVSEAETAATADSSESLALGIALTLTETSTAL